MYQRYDWGRLARFHVLDNRQYRSPLPCSKPGRGGSNVVLARACAELRDPARTMLGSEQEAWLAQGLSSSRAQWNILAQQTPMAQSSGVPVRSPGDGRFWTDGWDGYPAARRRLLDTLVNSGAKNPLVLAGDVHTFYASELRRDFSRPASTGEPGGRGGTLRHLGHLEFAPAAAHTGKRRTQSAHLYGRSDRRGYMLVQVTPQSAQARFMALDDVHDARSGQSELAAFGMSERWPGVQRA